jgi:integrase
MRYWDGRKGRERGTPQINTKEAALADELRAIREAETPPQGKRKEVPTLREWFWGVIDPAQPGAKPKGRFWTEWVLSKENKASEMEAKISIYRHHLGAAFGKMTLDAIDIPAIARFRTSLRQEKHLSKKTCNNILAVLSKTLRYAADAQVITHAPKVGLFKLERPEIEWWDYREYARVLDAAKREGPEWYAAVCLAGEAGLRVGEVPALRWREDVDLVAGTLTVNEQTRHGITGTPKGGRRRKIPMTPTLVAALKRLEVVRTGLVVRNVDGTPKTDGETTHAIRRICRGAGLPESGWHRLRHTFGTHAALLGLNPFRLQAYLGHRSMNETMLYVHVAEAHSRPMPPELLQAVEGETDPDRRVLVMLSARAGVATARVEEASMSA